jgi:hypothetical protein
VAAQRDPLSVRYDLVADRALRRAIRASRHDGSVHLWIASPRDEFRRLDKSGYTAHERAFIRACYYRIFRVPLNAHVTPDYSMKLPPVTAGPVTSGRPGYRQRQLRLRLWPRSKARSAPKGESWRDDPNLQSKVGDRMGEQWEDTG